MHSPVVSYCNTLRLHTVTRPPEARFVPHESRLLELVVSSRWLQRVDTHRLVFITSGVTNHR